MPFFAFLRRREPSGASGLVLYELACVLATQSSTSFSHHFSDDTTSVATDVFYDLTSLPLCPLLPSKTIKISVSLSINSVVVQAGVRSASPGY